MKKRKQKSIFTAEDEVGRSDPLNSDNVKNNDILESKEGEEIFLGDNIPYLLYREEENKEGEEIFLGDNIPYPEEEKKEPLKSIVEKETIPYSEEEKKEPLKSIIEKETIPYPEEEKKEPLKSIVEKEINVSPDKRKGLKISLNEFLQLKKYNTKMSILLKYKKFCSVQNIKEFSRKEFEEHLKNHAG